MTASRAEEIAEFAMLPAEAVGGVMAERKNTLAAFISRRSLSIASIRLPSRSIAR